MADFNDFQTLLRSLQSEDNDQRSQAEQTYEAIAAPTRLSLLLQSMVNTNATLETRTLAAVLCRRLIVNQYEQAFEQLPDETKRAIRQQLLLCIMQEANLMMRKKLADVAAELVKEHFDDDGRCTWPEFISFLVECCGSQNSGLKETGLHMFTAVPSVFGEQQATSLPLIAQMLGQAMLDESLLVRIAGVRALAAFVVNNAEEASVLQAMKDLLPHALQTIAASIEADPDDDTLLKALVDIADSATKYLRPYLTITLELCFKILQNTEVEDAQRHLSLEVIVSVSENAPASVRKAGKFIEPLIQTLVRMMTELEEEPNWSTVDAPEDDDDSSNAITAEMALDRFACAMGGQQIINQIINLVPPMLQSANWKDRYAGLMAVSACGEGCQKVMEGILGSILDAIIPHLADPHPRVRYAACNAIGQMATDFGPKLQKSYHAKVVPALMAVLNDFDNPRVQAHAGAALVNFSEAAPKNVLCEHLDELVAKLEQVMTAKFQELVAKGNKLVLEQIVTTVASVADSAEDKFAPYYDRFIPGLKYILEHANHPELRLLRGKTIECISLIGLAVGKERFVHDASDVMNLLLRTQTEGGSEELASDDPQVSYMISAWARICKLLGKDFEPYLPAVMGQVLKSANIKPDVCVLDNNEADTVESDIDWQVVKIGEDQNFAIRTSGLEDKATACQMLVCYAREIKEAFAQYCDEVLETMLPLLKFYFNDDVRSAAAESLPYLLDCARVRGEPYLASVWQRVSTGLLAAIPGEPERDLIAEDLESLAGCIERMGRGCFTEEQLTELYTLVDRLFKEHFEKHDERVAKRHDEDYDDVEEERLLGEKDEDEYVLSKLNDILHALFVTHKTDAVPFFQQLFPHIMKLLEANRPWSDFQWGLCFLDDLMEHTGPLSWQYRDCIVPAIVSGVQHSQPEVRQAAIFGIGVAAMFGGADYAPLLREVAPLMVQLIQTPESRSEVQNLSTENAISSLTKILKYQPDCLPGGGRANLDQFLATWISWLPIWEDTEETEHVYGQLCDLVEGNHPVILGPNNCNLPRIVHSIAYCIHKEGLSQEQPNYQRCLNIIRQVQTNEPVFNACLGQLTEEQRTSLSKALM